MKSARAQVLEWAEKGAIRPEAVEQALAIAGVTPDPARWQRFISALLLWLGVLFLAAGVIFFFAYNWDALGRFAKFGLVEGLLAATIITAWYLGPDSAAGKASIFFGALLTGALLALIGQTYQTGADPYELFAIWAVLILPWALVARLPVLWLLVIALLNLAVVLYFQVSHGIFGFLFGSASVIWAVAILNTAALLVWELAAALGVTWLRERWAVRLVAAASGACMSMLSLWALFESREVGGVGIVVYLLWLGAAYFYYRYRVLDLFVLAGSILSVIVFVASLMTRTMIRDFDAAGFLVIGLTVIGMSAAGAFWLRKIAAEEEAG